MASARSVANALLVRRTLLVASARSVANALLVRRTFLMAGALLVRRTLLMASARSVASALLVRISIRGRGHDTCPGENSLTDVSCIKLLVS